MQSRKINTLDKTIETDFGTKQIQARSKHVKTGKKMLKKDFVEINVRHSKQKDTKSIS